jgi:hypothetical protein
MRLKSELPGLNGSLDRFSKDMSHVRDGLVGLLRRRFAENLHTSSGLIVFGGYSRIHERAKGGDVQ